MSALARSVRCGVPQRLWPGPLLGCAPPVNASVDFRDGPRDECGVFGLHAPGRDVARLTYFGLYALQHRGQESAGIATSQQGHIMAMRDQGLVSQVFDEQRLRALRGDMAVGHVRYSTTGANSWENSQPVWRADRCELALAHNGNLVNAVELHGELRARGVTFRSTSDSEIIAALLSTHAAGSIEDAVADVMRRVEGAYSTVVMTKDRVVAFRDPAGLRPLSLGLLGDDCYVVASETCAFDIIGARFLRDVEPGEIVTLIDGGLRTRMGVAGARPALCVFEHIYFARPDSRLGGQVLQVARGRMGELLAREAPVDADLVIPVPDSGNPAARGFARASGLPQDDGFVKNRYVARTFIQPGQELRKHGLRLKFNPLPEVVAGKRLVVVDDSIVRGNTTRQIVQMLRDAGASEVHMRITAPPIRHPCHYGIDMSTTDEMIAHGRTEAEVAAELGADSLAYLSLDSVYEAIRSTRDVHCDACFSGEYPLEGTAAAQRKDAFESRPLPLAL
jgi:amidophosphoribosyltransferase